MSECCPVSLENSSSALIAWIVWNSCLKPRSPSACMPATRWMYTWAGIAVDTLPLSLPVPPLLPETDDSVSQSGTTLGDGVDGDDSSR